MVPATLANTFTHIYYTGDASALVDKERAMFLTVREVLDLPPLGELEIVAGREGLERHVTRVSVLEIVGGPFRWWRGGELFMSTLHMLHDASCSAHIELLKTLAGHYAAALILHPGIVGQRFLPELREIADELAFPLIQMPQDMPYAVVTDAVMGGLLGRQAAFLERSAAVNRELIQVTLEGGDLDDICRAVARRIRQPVAVVSADAVDVLGHSGETSDESRLLPDLLRRRTAGQMELSDSPICRVESDWPSDIAQVHRAAISIKRRVVTQLSAAVRTRDEVCAYLITWEAYGTMSELDFTVLAHACTAIGLEVLKRRAVTEAERKLHQGFYSAALSGEILSMDDATHRAHQARIELAPQYIVAAVASDRPLPEGALREIQRWTGSVAVQHEGSVVIILQVPASHRSAVDGAEQILDRMMSRAGTARFQHSIGLSQVVDGILELPAALAQARIALSVAGHLMDRRRPLRFDQLGIFKLLLALQQSSALAQYLHETIGPLLCARGSDDLLATLETYLDAGCSHQGAARVLEIHPNSVKYRIARVRQLLGDDALQNPIQRLGLHVALKARRISLTPIKAEGPNSSPSKTH